MAFYASIAGLSLLVAGGFVALGLWLVLPFAGLELLALGAGLYVGALRSTECEVVSLQGDTVQVQKGRRFPRESRKFARNWVQVSLEPPRHRWHPSRLVLASHGRRVEVGGFLTEEERLTLARRLRRAIRARPAVSWSE